MRRFLKTVGICLVVLLIVAGIVLYVLYRLTQHVPQFYEQALQSDPAEQAVAGEEAEKQALALVSDVQETQRWHALFTDKQINGWLAVDLVEKFPDLLPEGVTDPRVAIDPGGIRVGSRYESRRFSSVLNVTTEIYLTDQPNVVACRIDTARAGVLPLPLKRVIDEATEMARKKGLPLKWVEQDGDPVALLTLPDRHDEIEGVLRLETIELREGEIYFAGRTEPEP